MKNFGKLFLIVAVMFFCVANISSAQTIQESLNYKSQLASMHNILSGLLNKTYNQVSELQDFLNNEGYLASEPTGYFGLMTVKAVKAFQGAYGISQTGSVGPITMAKIKAISCK